MSRRKPNVVSYGDEKYITFLPTNDKSFKECKSDLQAGDYAPISLLFNLGGKNIVESYIVRLLRCQPSIPLYIIDEIITEIFSSNDELLYSYLFNNLNFEAIDHEKIKSYIDKFETHGATITECSAKNVNIKNIYAGQYVEILQNNMIKYNYLDNSISEYSENLPILLDIALCAGISKFISSREVESFENKLNEFLTSKRLDETMMSTYKYLYYWFFTVFTEQGYEQRIAKIFKKKPTIIRKKLFNLIYEKIKIPEDISKRLTIKNNIPTLSTKAGEEEEEEEEEKEEKEEKKKTGSTESLKTPFNLSTSTEKETTTQTSTKKKTTTQESTQPGVTSKKLPKRSVMTAPSLTIPTESSSELNKTISQLEDENTKLKNQLSKKTSEIQTLEKRINETESDNKVLKEEVDKLNNNINKLNNLISTLESENEKLKLFNKQLSETIETIKSTTTDEQVNKLLQENKELIDEISSLNEKVNKLQQENKELKDENSSLNEKKIGNENTIKKYEKELSTYRDMDKLLLGDMRRILIPKKINDVINNFGTNPLFSKIKYIIDDVMGTEHGNITLSDIPNIMKELYLKYKELKEQKSKHVDTSPEKPTAKIPKLTSRTKERQSIEFKPKDVTSKRPDDIETEEIRVDLEDLKKIFIIVKKLKNNITPDNMRKLLKKNPAINTRSILKKMEELKEQSCQLDFSTVERRIVEILTGK